MEEKAARMKRGALTRQWSRQLLPRQGESSFSFQGAPAAHCYVRQKEMKTAVRVLVVLASIYALAPPLSYMVLFTFALHQSAVIDLVVALSCVLLAYSSFKKLPSALWFGSLLVVALSASIGSFHHFRDSGESGPLPYEWLNHYFTAAVPLIVLAIGSRISDNRHHFWRK